MVAPDDQILIYGNSDERRKFIDNTLSQIDADYLEALQEYNKYLMQRNALLKQFAEQQTFDSNLLLAYDVKLAPLNNSIFEKRKNFIAELMPVFNSIYTNLSNGNETVALEYDSSLHFKEGAALLQENIEKDRAIRRTSEGIHKDDLVFTMRGGAIKKFGSQGQQKTFLLSLKMAQAFVLEKALNKSPLLLLDDIFDKLDLQRSKNLLQYLKDHYKGQIFITDTQRTRIEKHFGDHINEIEIFEISL
jgi:DNA replication and repair protein RecF